MSSTITAMFDTRADAEAAKERLKASNVDADHIHVHDQSSAGYNEQGYSTHNDRGIWESVKNAFLPDEDRHTYEEGVRRGGAVLTADVDDDAFRERTIDMTATGEEAVVGKTARVVEEVVVSKTADERVEQIYDTVRRTDVEVERDQGVAAGSGSTFDSDRR